MKARRDIIADFAEAPPQYSEFRYIVRVFFRRKLAVIGFVIILLLLLTAIFAPVLAPYDPIKVDLDNTLLQPCWDYPLGTDATGRDTLSRIIYGTRTSLAVAFGAMAIAASAGIIIGLVAGYFGGIVYVV